MSVVCSSSTSSIQRPPPTYEFTKRKRWAELLVAELADAIAFVLSASGQILYCTAAVKEILGWTEEEMIDEDLFSLVISDDQAKLRGSLDKSVRTRTDFTTYVYLICKNQFASGSDYPGAPRDIILFEIKGRPHHVAAEDDEEAFTCIFAVAKPYPGVSESKLDTILDLKIENERSQQRLLWLKAMDPSTRHPGIPGHYQASMHHPQTSSVSRNARPRDLSACYPTLPGASWAMSNDLMPSPTRNTFDDAAALHSYMNEVYPPALIPFGAEGEIISEDGSKKKKLKKAQLLEQYVCVTCGRTDSPEWRKGPSGPKTLCNACGLRWAKQMRKFDDPGEAVVDLDAS